METHQAFFNDLAPRWDSMRPPERIERIRGLLARFRLTWQNTPSILDVGTGTGLLLPLLRAHAPQSNIVAIDLAQEMLARANSRAGAAGLVQADGRFLPVASGAFQVAVCHAVLPHLPDQPAALAELRRVLRPGGTLLIFHEISRAEVNAIHQRVGQAIAADVVPPPGQLGVTLNAAGFEPLQIEDTPSHYLVVGQAW